MGSHSESVRSAGANQSEGVASGDGARDHRVAVETASVETDGGSSASTEAEGTSTTREVERSSPSDQRAEGSTRGTPGADDPGAALEAEVERLRTELARRETELATVVDRYERLLERRDRAANDRADDGGVGGVDGETAGAGTPTDPERVDWVARTVGRAVEAIRRR